ncbi:MAG: tripartite tricarboxylate transporter TctB family protein [Hyphomicrobiaceae bacterium]
MRSPQDLGAGLFLLAIALFAFWGTWSLDLGTLRSIGPGMLPRATAILVAGFGILLIISSFATQGSPLDRWHIRGPFFVLGAALLFAWTVRPLGLIVAGPLCLMFGSMADKATRPVEIVIFAVVMTALCIGMFGFILGLPIPIMPTSLPYPLDMLKAG